MSATVPKPARTTTPAPPSVRQAATVSPPPKIPHKSATTPVINVLMPVRQGGLPAAVRQEKPATQSRHPYNAIR